MKLNQWISENNLKDSHFAELAGLHRVQVHRILKRGKRPSDDEMQAIYATTKGAVTANDFYDLPEQTNTPAKVIHSPSSGGASNIPQS